DGDPSQFGEFFATQSGRTATSAFDNTYRRRSDAVTPVPHGRAELPRVHPATVHHAAAVVLALVVLRQPGHYLTLRSRPTLPNINEEAKVVRFRWRRDG